MTQNVRDLVILFILRKGKRRKYQVMDEYVAILGDPKANKNNFPQVLKRLINKKQVRKIKEPGRMLWLEITKNGAEQFDRIRKIFK